jgi:hypothetical protein
VGEKTCEKIGEKTGEKMGEKMDKKMDEKMVGKMGGKVGEERCEGERETAQVFSSVARSCCVKAFLISTISSESIILASLSLR